MSLLFLIFFFYCNHYHFYLQKRFEGTRVTVETFMKWKEKFNEETGYNKKKELAEKEGKKLTGRELFMTDKTLDQSDLKFLDDGKIILIHLRFDFKTFLLCY